jgi:hypothetical protein
MRLLVSLFVVATVMSTARALTGGASNALEPMHAESVESESVDTTLDSDALAEVDEVEREWLSDDEAAFLETAEQSEGQETTDAEEEEDTDEDETEGGAVELEVGADKRKDKKKKKKNGPAKPYTVPCDISAKRGICLFDGQKVIVPDAGPKGLIGRYSFDDNPAIDNSRFGNHGAQRIESAPGRGGAGSSASFNGDEKKFVEIPTSKSLATLSEFSLSFWIYFPETLDPHLPKDCPIIAKGVNNDRKLFSFSVDASTRTLTFNSLRAGGKVSSRGRIGPHRWTHVAAVRSAKSLSLFLHGVLDQTEQSSGGLQEPESPVYIGHVPWSDKNCRVPFYIDDLRIYSRALSRAEIEAESFPSLGAIEPSFSHLGCLSCGYGDAVGSCRSGYHLCSQIELNAGAYQVARAMGWGDSQTHIWANIGNSNPPPGVRLAMCCGGL